MLRRDCPGGPALGPRLLSMFGEDRERFDSAEQVQMMSGIAPVMKVAEKDPRSPGGAVALGLSEVSSPEHP